MPEAIAAWNHKIYFINSFWEAFCYPLGRFKLKLGLQPFIRLSFQLANNFYCKSLNSSCLTNIVINKFTYKNVTEQILKHCYFPSLYEKTIKKHAFTLVNKKLCYSQKQAELFNDRRE